MDLHGEDNATSEWCCSTGALLFCARGRARVCQETDGASIAPENRWALSLSLSVYVCGSSGASPFSKRDCLLKKGGGGKGGGI